MTAALAAMLRAVPRPDGLDDCGAPEPEEMLAPEPYGLGCDTAGLAGGAGLPPWVQAGERLRVKKTPANARHGIYVQQPFGTRTLFTRAWPGEILTVERRGDELVAVLDEPRSRYARVTSELLARCARVPRQKAGAS